MFIRGDIREKNIIGNIRAYLASADRYMRTCIN